MVAAKARGGASVTRGSVNGDETDERNRVESTNERADGVDSRDRAPARPRAGVDGIQRKQ